MAEIVSFNGADVPDQPSAPLDILRATIAEIEAGLPVESLMILLQVRGAPGTSLVRREVRDTGITASLAIFWLEMHKAQIVADMFAPT